MRAFSQFRPASIGYVALLLGACSTAVAADVTAIEEDWQIDVATPSSLLSSPQINCLTAAVGNVDSYYALLLVNQKSAEGGGMELQLWKGQTLLSSSQLGNGASLATPGERIQWTTRMELSPSGLLTVQVLSGTSITWGKFGDNTTSLFVSAQTTLQSLNAYDSNVTTNASGVELGNLRVNKLMLRKVRIYVDNDHSIEQVLDRVIYESR